METSSTCECEGDTMTVEGSVLSDDALLRTPFYCEENVWRLLQRKILAKNDEENSPSVPPTFYVVYISNASRRVMMQYQRASQDLTITWDYHVILISSDDAAMVYDVDTKLLPYPMPLRDYLAYSFPNLPDCFESLRPCFRLIPGNQFIESFSSDRRHMYNTTTQCWNAPPPTYDCILAKKQPYENTHSFYIDFTGNTPSQLSNEARGEILTLTQLLDFFSGSHIASA